MPRFSGHAKGVEMVRETVRSCLERGVEYLTLFAFSSENWRRPQDEVSLLMQLFVKALEQEVVKLDRNSVRLRVIGDLSRFDDRLQGLIRSAEERTAANSRLHLTIAANYGGRWDIMQAVNAMLESLPDKRSGWVEADLEPFLSMHYAPEPDLFIRTGGEERISNFLLVAACLHRVVFYRDPVAGIRSCRVRSGDCLLSESRTTLRSNQRAVGRCYRCLRHASSLR